MKTLSIVLFIGGAMYPINDTGTEEYWKEFLTKKMVENQAATLSFILKENIDLTIAPGQLNGFIISDVTYLVEKQARESKQKEKIVKVTERVLDKAEQELDQSNDDWWKD